MKIFIDLDGTLIDIKKRQYDFFISVMKNENLKPKIIPSLSWYWRNRRLGISDIGILKKLGININPEKYYDKKNYVIESPAFLKKDYPFIFTRQFLGCMKKKHKLILISQRINTDTALQQLLDLKLDGYFDEVHFSGNRGYSKEKIIRNCTRVIGDDSIIIGDSEADFLASKKLGLDYFLVSSGVRSRAFLSKICENSKILSSVKDILDRNLI